MKRLAFCLIFLLIAVDTFSAELKEVRYSHSEEKTRVVFELDRSVQYVSGFLREPARIYFDLKDVRNGTRRDQVEISRGPVKRIRIGRFKRDVLRIVVDLKSEERYRTFFLNSPPRIVLDIIHEADPFFRPRRVVVIDPGHGGEDPGAIGPGGLKEKDVTLDIAKRLKKILENRYKLKVYLTRDNDRFVSLKDRTLLANRYNADVFVSIHINASRRKTLRGVETYLLNWTNDEEALKVAARENAISVEKMKKSQTELGMILASLERESKRDESLRLAYHVHNSLVGRLSRYYREIEDLGVKQALFYVLVGAEMPSVLVEVGFISNPKEERLLRKASFRQRTAEALGRGIYRYILTLPGSPKLAMAGEDDTG